MNIPNSSIKNNSETSDNEQGRSTPSVLVVDDDDTMRASVEALLQLHNYNCLAANGGASALDILKEASIELVLLDLNMPGVDGYQVMHEIHSRFPDTDIIIVSGESSFNSATLALRYGAEDYLRKPYIPDELIVSIENVLKKRRLKSQFRQLHGELEASEERFRFIVNNSPDIIYILDNTGHFSYVNQRINPILGYEDQDLIGKHYSELVHADDINKAKFAFNERRTGARATSSIELRLLHKEDEQGARYFENQSIVIELNSMGVYSTDHGLPIDREFIGTYGVARDITERKRAEELITFQIHHDLLTKLPNRALFRDRLTQAISQAKRNDNKLAIVYLDVDRFKAINDSLGHLAGDQLLQNVASILKSSIRDCDTVARVGGDEFNLLLTNIKEAKDIEVIVDKITEKLELPAHIDHHEIPISCSFGIALYPDHGDSIDALIRNADTAMYYIKGKGANQCQLFNEKIASLHGRHLSLENDLRKAIKENQLSVYFQPQFCVSSGEITGVEALVRWHHPDEGLIMPDEFIPLSEETGLIVDLGRWMLRNSCEKFSSWADDSLSKTTLAVNFSSKELMQPDFTEFVINTLAQYNIPGSQFEVEITENVLMDDMDQAIIKLKLLADHGIKVAVDDFGTGYSSLTYLQTLPLHTLKIDRSFIVKIQYYRDKHSIVEAIIAMAKELGLDLVAEGIETEEQLNYLKRIGCGRAQGFFLGKPIEADILTSQYISCNTCAVP